MARLSDAVRKRCPVCGEKRIWKSFGQTVETCPSCGYHFEREEGYWVGGLVVAIGMAIAIFFLLLAAVLLFTWPDVPWTVLSIAALIAMALSPVLLYPHSKTIWVWIDITFLQPHDRS